MPDTSLTEFPPHQLVLIGSDAFTESPSPSGSAEAVWYPSALDEILVGGFSLQTDDFVLYPVATPYDSTHEFRSDLPVGAVVGNPSAQFSMVPFSTTFEEEFTMALFSPSVDPLITDGITSQYVRAAVIVLDTGSAATDRLLAYLGLRTDSRLVDQRPEGGSVTWTFPDGIVAI